MANYSTLKTAVQNVVKTNGNRAITGANLQSVLLSIINSVGGGGYIFKGVATPSTSAGTPDENVFYIGGAGTYANFGSSVTVPVGSICVFKYNGSWVKEQIALFAGIDDVPTAGSNNLVKSGGVKSEIDITTKNISNILIGGGVGIHITDFPNTGRYMPNGSLSQTGWYHTNLIACDENVALSLYVAEGSSTSTPIVIYYNSNQQQIGYELASGSATYKQVSLTTPSNTAYIRVQTALSENAYFDFNSNSQGIISIESTCEGIQEDIAEIQSSLTQTQNEINIVNDVFYYGLLKINGFVHVNGNIRTDNGYLRTDYLDASNINSVSIYTAVSAYGSVSVVAWFTEDKTFISNVVMQDANPKTVFSLKPNNAKYIILSSDVNHYKIVNGSATIKNTSKEAYIGANGDDANNGTESHPVKSIYAAKALGADSVIFKAGDYFDYNIDFGLFTNYTFKDGARLICGNRIEEATLATGYSRVYQSAVTGSFTGSFLWQHDIADENTIIDTDEYMPQYHSGKTHRLSSTRLYHASSISEIESTTNKYMWYLTGGVLYFSAPSSNFTEHPIVIPDGSNKMYSSFKGNDVVVIGLTILYRSFNSYKLSGRFDGGFIGYSDYTCFYFNPNKYLELNRFECAGGNPDGFGGGNTDNVNYDIVMKNCYGHDNADDGESGHILTNITQYGGLFEYNGSGVTPAVGAMGSYYGTICRKNGVHDWTVGFQDGGGFTTAAGNNPKTYILCVDCLSEDNKVGFAGKGTCINCIAKNNSSGSYGSNLKQYNCVTL